jgi:hypothetical protein
MLDAARHEVPLKYKILSSAFGLGFGALIEIPWVGINAARTGVSLGFMASSPVLSGIAIYRLGKGLLSNLHHVPGVLKEKNDSVNIGINNFEVINKKESSLKEGLRTFQNMQHAAYSCSDLDVLGMVGREIYENSKKEVPGTQVLSSI